MKPIDPDGFEALFRKNVDPWDYARSPFESYKRDRLLQACGDRIYGRGLELACANGETTRRLATRCLRLLAVDSSETAVREAARRTAGLANVVVDQALLPGETPRGPFDLIVASEILYYMSLPDMLTLLEQLQRALAPGGRLVVLHHVIAFADASQPPALAQRRAKGFLTEALPLLAERRERRFEVFAVEKPAR
ncbi:MAG: class I SAM-dependent methyltransferase [Brevundimonas sp.]|uniref:class I SAM-dependent methyltransferase n=1 Tax=Brevundimonas sp. TaxID=1871086 RepID=UPI00391C8F5C